MSTPIPVFPPENQFGKQSIPGMKAYTGERRLRKVAHARLNLFHRAKNGVYDPITYFHVVDTLIEIVPGHTFQTRDMVDLLNQTRPLLVWDAPTVGRVLADLADTLNEVNGAKIISSARRWDGMIYSTPTNLEARVAMVHLLDDLIRLTSTVIEAEKRGEAPKRINSPLRDCPSVN